MDTSALMKLSYGLYVIGVKNNNSYGGCIVDAVAQVSAADPPNVAVSSNAGSLTNMLIKKEREFTLSVLSAGVDPFVIANFGFQSARNVEKWANVTYFMRDGLPCVEGAVAYLRLLVTDIKELGTHTLFICETADAWMCGSGEKPLIYADYQSSMRNETMAAFQAFQTRNG